MRILTKRLQQNFNLFLFGDDHEGTSLRHDDGWNMLVEMMNSPYDGLDPKYNYGIDHGDIIEAVTIDDPRYDGITTEGNVLQQIRQAVKNREFIKNKLIVIMEGNHPLKLWRFSGIKGQGITQDICRQLGVPFGTWTSRITYKDTKGKLLFKHFVTHGHRSINSTADDPKRRITNMELILKRILKAKAGDCVLSSMGHTHKLLLCRPAPELYITDNGTKTKQNYTTSHHTDDYIHPDQRWFVNTGSFYKLYGEGYSGYAEIAGYDPVELGFWIVKVRDGIIDNIDRILLK